MVYGKTTSATEVGEVVMKGDWDYFNLMMISPSGLLHIATVDILPVAKATKSMSRAVCHH